jgi:polysaccharide export outer membrane protein
MKKNFYIIVVLFYVLQSCGVNSNLMFKNEKGIPVITDDIPISPEEAYRLAPDDKFIFTLYANEGKRLIDIVSGAMADVDGGGGQRLGLQNKIDYLIRPDGITELPILGEVKLAGLSVKEAQDLLAKKYNAEYTSPYVQLEVTNRRVIVFPGNGGDATVVPIMNNNTTLLEALALAGGITERGKAKKIKILRNTYDGRVIYQIDLSTMSGIKYADMVVQANDYIYVEPTAQLTREVFREIAPVISIISTTIVILSVLSRL